MLDLSLSSIFAGLIFGTFGMYVVKLGKQRANFYLLVSGIAMIVYPYLVTNPILLWGIGIALSWFSYEFRNRY